MAFSLFGAAIGAAVSYLTSDGDLTATAVGGLTGGFVGGAGGETAGSAGEAAGGAAGQASAQAAGQAASEGTKAATARGIPVKDLSTEASADLKRRAAERAAFQTANPSLVQQGIRGFSAGSTIGEVSAMQQQKKFAEQAQQTQTNIIRYKEQRARLQLARESMIRRANVFANSANAGTQGSSSELTSTNAIQSDMGRLISNQSTNRLVANQLSRTQQRAQGAADRAGFAQSIRQGADYFATNASSVGSIFKV